MLRHNWSLVNSVTLPDIKCFNVFRKLLVATRGQKNQEGKNGLGDHLAKKFQIREIMMMTTKMEMIRVTVLMMTMMMKMPMELLWKGTP